MTQYMICGLGVYDGTATRQFFIPGFGLILDNVAGGTAYVKIINE